MPTAHTVTAPVARRASIAACAFAPGLEAALAGVPLAASGPLVAMAGEAGRPRLRLAPPSAPGVEPAILREADAPLLRFEPQSDPFGCWLAVALAGAVDRPAAADPASLELLSLAERVAAGDIAVLIEGPTGAGKEGLARFIHARSSRAAGALVAVNCAALPEAMLEAILFGHERGAFTGAAGESLGLFRAAQGGTLLLDEVGELSPSLQAKLLRALQEREVLPLGATRPVPVDARVLAATNRDLAGEVAAGRLREDLYWRLAVFPLRVAPLSQRPADIPVIAAALLLRHGASDGRWWPTAAAVEAITRAPWPGNVRQLENVLLRALLLAGDGRIDIDHLTLSAGPAQTALLPRHRTGAGGAASVPACATRLSDVVRAHETAAIAEALAASGGRRIDAARRLGISERTLRYKLAQLAHAAEVPWPQLMAGIEPCSRG
jgi:two-component system response regulator FlrC